MSTSQTDPHPAGRAPSPAYTAGERRADGVMHALGVLAAPPAAVLLLTHSSGGQALGAAAYVFGLMAMVSCSALYNMTNALRWKESLRRADRAAIFALVAGTYSAYLTGPLGAATGEPWRALLLTVIWAAALSAAVLEIRHPRRFERTTLALALLLGWCGVVLIGPMIETLSPPVLLLLVGGGVCYSAGVGFHLWRSLPYHNAVWHGFVLSAAACHFISIYLMVVGR